MDVIARQLIVTHFVGRFPYFEQTDRWMETIEDGQRHRYVSDDRPSPDALENQKSKANNMI